MRKFSDKSCRDKTHILCSIIPLPTKIVPYMRYLEKYGAGGQATI
jgi:hypothetical protein